MIWTIIQTNLTKIITFCSLLGSLEQTIEKIWINNTKQSANTNLGTGLFPTQKCISEVRKTSDEFELTRNNKEDDCPQRNWAENARKWSLLNHAHTVRFST